MRWLSTPGLTWRAWSSVSSPAATEAESAAPWNALIRCGQQIISALKMAFHLPASMNTRQPNGLFLLGVFLSCKSRSSLRIFSISHRPSQELNAFTRGRGVESTLLYLCIFLNTWHLWELKNTPFSLMKQNIIGCPPWNVPLGPRLHLAGLPPGP